MLIHIAFYIIGWLTSVACLAQQKMQFTQYMFSGVVINPAYAGADNALSLTFIQRSQWSGLENAPTTQTFSAHSLVKKKQIGVGLTLINDQIGVHRNQSVLTQYAFHIPASDHSNLSFGLQAGMYSLRSDYASLGNQNNDPVIHNTPVLTQTFFDLGAGVYYRSPKLHVGLSAPELIPQQFIFSDTISVRLEKVNMFLYSRYTFPINEYTELEPSVLLKYMSSVPLSFDFNVNLVYRKVLALGASYRKKESIDLLIKMRVTPQLQLGYAYDYPIGVVSLISNGSHELMANYVFKDIRKKVASPR